ncbi:DJ-1/YajL/PfpI superfamily protein [Lachnospiraceae bacterium KM106-2]|nr:DJ-1/YajL/PfpI superfamily protein [Lachnospiraceae bacterium KM106-2]
MSKVFVFLADGFEEIEGLTVVDLLRRAEIDVTMISVTDTIEVMGAHGIVVTADKIYEEVHMDEADMLVLPGGMPGTKTLGKHEPLVTKLKEFEKQGKWIAAICAAPSVLGMNGILQGRKATCYPGFEDKLQGAEVVKDKVVIDNHVITSRGLGTAIEFASEIIAQFKGQETARKIKEDIIYL